METSNSRGHFKKISQMVLWKRYILLAAISLVMIITAVLITNRPSEMGRIVYAAHGWHQSYYRVDGIRVYGNSFTLDFCLENNPIRFKEAKALLNPFVGNNAFSISASVDIGGMEKVASVAYYIGCDRLFEAGIHLVGYTALYDIVHSVFFFEGERAVIVIDERGLFGYFGERHLSVESLFTNPK